MTEKIVKLETTFKPSNRGAVLKVVHGTRECRHAYNYKIDKSTGVVTCEDCHKELDKGWVVQKLIEALHIYRLPRQCSDCGKKRVRAK